MQEASSYFYDLNHRIDVGYDSVRANRVRRRKTAGDRPAGRWLRRVGDLNAGVFTGTLESLRGERV